MTSASAGEALREFFWGKKRHGFSAMRRKSHVGLMLGDCVHIEGGFLSHRQLCRAPRSIKLFYNQQLIILSSSKLVQKFQDKRGKGYVRKFVKNLELFFNLKSMNISFKKKERNGEIQSPPQKMAPRRTLGLRRLSHGFIKCHVHTAPDGRHMLRLGEARLQLVSF